MRFIYLDEAGTSEREPVAVVVAVVIQADSQWRVANNYLESLRERFVPEAVRPGFCFHAKNLFPKKSSLPIAEDSRWKLLLSLASAPRKLRLSFAYGWCRKQDNYAEGSKAEAVLRHQNAFGLCLKQANDMVETHHPGEVASVIAEDCTHMRSSLKMILPAMRDPRMMSILRISKSSIVDSVHFAEKKDAPLLQLADAVAFSLRRFISGQPRGQELFSAVTGSTSMEGVEKDVGCGVLIHKKVA